MLSGNATEVYEKLLEIQNLSNQFHFSASFENELTKLANSARNMSDQYKDFYNQYILQEKILTTGSSYSDSFKDITTAYDAYSDAFASGDESKIKEASEKYASTLTDAMDSAIANGDTDVASYFENMYPAMQSIVSGWNFNMQGAECIAQGNKKQHHFTPRPDGYPEGVIRGILKAQLQ